MIVVSVATAAKRDKVSPAGFRECPRILVKFGRLKSKNSNNTLSAKQMTSVRAVVVVVIVTLVRLVELVVEQ